VLVMDKGVEVILLQNVELATRDENIMEFVVTPEDAIRVEHALERGQFKFQLRRL
jgi:hypothetical protein